MMISSNNFYGNTNSLNQKGFIFDKIYPNRSSLNNNDEVFLNRFVLINYNIGQDDENAFNNNYAIDKSNNFGNCHSKIFVKTIDGYLEIAKIQTKLELSVDNDGILCLQEV